MDTVVGVVAGFPGAQRPIPSLENEIELLHVIFVLNTNRQLFHSSTLTVRVVGTAKCISVVITPLYLPPLAGTQGST